VSAVTLIFAVATTASLFGADIVGSVDAHMREGVAPHGDSDGNTTSFAAVVQFYS